MIEGLEKLLKQGKDSPELRFGLGNAYLNDQQPQQAELHLRACVQQKPDYSAAWKLLAKALQQQQQLQAALDTYRQGITIAEQQGDEQTLKEMQVFYKRLQKQLQQP